MMPRMKKTFKSFDADWTLIRTKCVRDPECCYPETTYQFGALCNDEPLIVPSNVYITFAGIPASCAFGNGTPDYGEAVLQNRTYPFELGWNPYGGLVQGSPNPSIIPAGPGGIPPAQEAWHYRLIGNPPTINEDANVGIIVSENGIFVGSITVSTPACSNIVLDHYIRGSATLRCSLTPGISYWTFIFGVMVISPVHGIPIPPVVLFNPCPYMSGGTTPLGTPIQPLPISMWSGPNMIPFVPPGLFQDGIAVYTPNVIPIEAEYQTDVADCFVTGPGPFPQHTATITLSD